MTSAKEAELVINGLRIDFYALDKFQNGYLDQKTFLESIPLTEQYKKKGKEIFNQIDTNKDGRISFDEYIEFVFFQFGWNMDNEVFDRCLWISLDRSGSGAISFDDYQKFYARKLKYKKKHLKKSKCVEAPKSVHELKAEFDKIDTRSKGLITFKELQDYMDGEIK